MGAQQCRAIIRTRPPVAGDLTQRLQLAMRAVSMAEAAVVSTVVGAEAEPTAEAGAGNTLNPRTFEGRAEVLALLFLEYQRQAP